jgi:hypothetical protein
MWKIFHGERLEERKTTLVSAFQVHGIFHGNGIFSSGLPIPPPHKTQKGTYPTISTFDIEGSLPPYIVKGKVSGRNHEVRH